MQKTSHIMALALAILSCGGLVSSIAALPTSTIDFLPEQKLPDRENVSVNYGTPQVDQPSIDSNDDSANEQTNIILDVLHHVQAQAAGSGVFYFSDNWETNRFGFRFVNPDGYIVEPAATIGDTTLDPENIPLQQLQVWKASDFYNLAYQPELSPLPPAIRISIYRNPAKQPLTHWQSDRGEAVQPVTIAGQTGIAYTVSPASVGNSGNQASAYSVGTILLNSPNQRFVIQIAGDYLDRQDVMLQTLATILTSFTFDLSADAFGKPQINYSTLQTLLTHQNWAAANTETMAVMQRLSQLYPASLLYSEPGNVLSSIPCQDIRSIDRLWTEASDGRFGYTAQARLWEQTMGSDRERVDQFGQLTGWRRTEIRPEAYGIADWWKQDTELVTTGEAPTGLFPWAGVAASTINRMMSEPGCGSCQIDAMYLTGDRFYDVVPDLLDKVEHCSV